ncbi:toll/interleukin-1 receptor domain-containing protein [Aeromonas salmonicida]|uniref:toll/interleukin-1 receptor domain-containing protein n=1 Tax=Aeromonas salmonicida TaxID=645 RepID=UPI001F35F754|nr:toll/interleukin-1 receptor domain-containing protein [Aeromonas salmonicida]MCE9935837.1 toll/interleukin-1 receptor domain-containing protein [Aeromonas salmonicida]
METKKIFISYSWDNEVHKQWTLNLANQLEEYSELHITLDQYDLDSFSDKNHFMESGVFDNDYVILIITPEYVIKSNSRSGGVGIETKLASSRHWEESLALGSSKIIPLLRHGTELYNYIKEKFYIDFRDDEKFYASFEQLIKNITGASKSVRPSKKKSLQKIPIHKDLTKNEEFLKINHKKDD